MSPQRRMMDRRLGNLYEKQWIEQTFHKRECVKYVASDKQINKCQCGRLKLAHPVKPESTMRVAYPVQRWSVVQHTELSPTDAYGTIEFQGGPHPTKAQYVRLSYDTRPERVMQLLQQQWGLDLPKLLISVHGGIANFDLQPKLKRVCHQGLLQAAKTTGAWIITGGTNTGVMKHVGDALGDTMVQARNNIVTIGVAPWGVVHRNEELIGKDVVKPYHANALPKGNSVVLNCNHSYFLLVDDGTIGKFGCEIVFRKKLEKYISQQKITFTRGNSAKNYSTPVVCLVMEGGSNTIRSVLDCLTDIPPVPVVVCDGSGRAADLLSFTHKFAQDDGTMPESLRDQLLLTINKTFRCTADRAEQIFIELMLCVRKRHLITVFRIGEATQDIDLAILAALLKSQNSSAPDQLNLALTWNRVDIARSHIFVYGQEWPEGSLDHALMDALVNDRVDFVKLILENGINLHKWLTIERLEELYNLGLNFMKATPSKAVFVNVRQKVDSASTLRFLLREYKKHIPSDYRYTLLDIGEVINILMGGAYQSTYCRKKFRLIYNSVMHRGRDVGSAVGGIVPSVVPLADPSALSNVFKYPYSELMVWAVLLRRQKMARFMWQLGDEAMAKALVAFKLYKSMARESEEDDLEIDVANEILAYAKEFHDLALDLLEQCRKTNEEMTQLLLTYELCNWSDQTCLSIAVAGAHRAFIANTSCQILLTEMWMGGLRTRKYANLKVILGIVCFPSFLLLEYRTREELQLMPQTKEEHIQDMRESSDSDSDTDSDADSDRASVASSRHSVQSDQRPALSSQPVVTSVQVSGGGDKNSGSHDGVEPLSRATSDVNIFNPFGRKSQLNVRKKIYEFYMAPITKFWMHTISYVIFLLMFIYTVLIRTLPMPEWNEWYIFIYMVGLAFEKFREFFVSEPTKLRQKLRLYFCDMWNIIDTLATTLFFTGFTIRMCPGLESHGRVFYSLTITIFIIRILDFLDVSRRLGPLIHIIGKMVIQMLYFIVFLLIIIIAYGVLLQSLWFPDQEFRWESVRDIFIKPYFNLYGEVYAGEVWPECTSDANDTENPFKCVPGRWIAPVGQTVFLIIGIILLLNLLIATFNAIFLRTNAISHLLWKFQRYVLVIEYEARPILPPPLVILCHIYLLAKYIRRKCRHKRKFFDNGLKLFLGDEAIEKLHDFEEECLDAYFHEGEQKQLSSVEERVRLTTDRLESVILRLDDIHQRENAIRVCLQTMDSHLARLDDQSTKNSELLYSLQHTLGIQNVSDITPGNSVIESILRQARENSGSPQRMFNEERLRPFTEYHRQPSRHPPLHRGMSMDASDFERRYGGGPSGRMRHNSMSIAEEMTKGVVPSSRCLITAANIGNTDSVDHNSHHHVRFSDVPDYSSDSGTGAASVGGAARGPAGGATGATAALPATGAAVSQLFSRSLSNPAGVKPPSTLRVRGWTPFMPLTPIVTPTRIEYTSITDDIDTSCVSHDMEDSPPNTPDFEPRSPRGGGATRGGNTTGRTGGGHRKKSNHHQHRHKHKMVPVTVNEGLMSAEETEHQQMDVMVHRRMRQLSLTENDNFIGLAKQALESLDASSLEECEEREAARAHYSDDEGSTSVAMAMASSAGALNKPTLKSIRSEPVLKKKKGATLESIHSPSDDDENYEFVTPQQSTGDDSPVQFVASSDGVVVHFTQHADTAGTTDVGSAAGTTAGTTTSGATAGTTTRAGTTGNEANDSSSAAAKNLSVC